MRKIDVSSKTCAAASVQRAGRGEVAAERLLDDHAARLRRSRTAPSCSHDRLEQGRRDRQVVQRRAARRRAACAARRRSPGRRSRRRRSAAARTAWRTPPRSSAAVLARGCRGRAPRAGRAFQPALATPITGTSRCRARPSPAAPGRSSCRPGRRWRRRRPARRTVRIHAVPRNPLRSLLPAFSRWPPNAKRIAESSLSAKSASPREVKRSNSAAVSTGAGTASSIAALIVQRPSPESETRPANFASSGSLDQRRGGQVEQPRGDHAAAPPDLGDVAQVRGRTGSARDRAAAWSRRRPCVLALADVGVLAGCSGPRHRRP